MASSPVSVMVTESFRLRARRSGIPSKPAVAPESLPVGSFRETAVGEEEQNAGAGAAGRQEADAVEVVVVVEFLVCWLIGWLVGWLAKKQAQS